MKKIIYLNNAATSWPKPDCVAEAMSNAIKNPPGSMHRGGIDDYDVFDALRIELAEILGVSDYSQIALGANATWGLNLALFGYPFNKEDIILTTKSEHNSMLRPLHVLKQEKRVSDVIYLDNDTDGIVNIDIWESAITKYKPRLVCFTHASNVTGAVCDAEAICKAAKENGADVLIDASQTAGLKKIEAEKWGADMLAFTGHKYLLGPQGTGGLWVSEKVNLKPHLVGGTGIFSDMADMPDEMPIHLEAGTGNEPSFYGLLSAVLWAKENPLDEKALMGKLEYLKKALRETGVNLVETKGDVTPIITFNIPNYTDEEVGFILAESYDIITRTGLHCAPLIFKGLKRESTVRVSLSRFTTDEEIQELINAIKDIML